MRFLTIIIVGAVLTSAGCDRVLQEVAQDAPEKPAVEAVPLKTPNEAQLNAFVGAMLEASASGDPANIADLVDWDAFAQRSGEGLDMPAEMLRGFVQGARQGAILSGIAASIAEAVKAGGSFQQLTTRRTGPEAWAVFRLLLPEGGFDHVSFLVTARNSGIHQAVDVFMLSTGELISKTARRMLLPLATQANRSLIERLTSEEALLMQHIDKLQTMQQAQAAGDPEAGLRIYHALPQALQDDKTFMLVRMGMASGADDGTYRKAIEDMGRLFPDDPATAVSAIDGHVLRKRWDDALGAIDTVAKNTTPDAYFDVLRANVLVGAGKLAEAERSARSASTAEPNLRDGWWALLDTLVRQKKYTEAAAVVLEMRARFGLQFDFEGVPEYGAFRASDAYDRLQADLAEPTDGPGSTVP